MLFVVDWRRTRSSKYRVYLALPLVLIFSHREAFVLDLWMVSDIVFTEEVYECV